MNEPVLETLLTCSYCGQFSNRNTPFCSSCSREEVEFLDLPLTRKDQEEIRLCEQRHKASGHHTKNFKGMNFCPWCQVCLHEAVWTESLADENGFTIYCCYFKGSTGPEIVLALRDGKVDVNYFYSPQDYNEYYAMNDALKSLRPRVNAGFPQVLLRFIEWKMAAIRRRIQVSSSTTRRFSARRSEEY